MSGEGSKLLDLKCKVRIGGDIAWCVLGIDDGQGLAIVIGGDIYNTSVSFVEGRAVYGVLEMHCET